MDHKVHQSNFYDIFMTFWTSNLFLIIKENWIRAMTRHAESNINILLTRNSPIDSGVRQWSYPLMIPLHCLWIKTNSSTFCFSFDFVSLTCTVQLLFHILLDGVGGVHLKLDVQGQRCGNISDVDEQGWASYVYRP